MQAADTLVLKDVHQGVPPSFWPPAPGWWLMLALLVIIVGIACFVRLKRKRRERALRTLFDQSLAQARTPAEQVAAMSALLRRAARKEDPGADKLAGDDWLRFLDQGLTQPVFAAGAGRLLGDGAFRRDVSEAEIAGLRTVVRTRFLQWMAPRRVRPALKQRRR